MWFQNIFYPFNKGIKNITINPNLVACCKCVPLKQIIELPGKFRHLIQLCWNRKSVGTVDKRSPYNWAEELCKTEWSDNRKWICACWQIQLNEKMLQQVSVEGSTLKKPGFCTCFFPTWFVCYSVYYRVYITKKVFF